MKEESANLANLHEYMEIGGFFILVSVKTPDSLLL